MSRASRPTLAAGPAALLGAAFGLAAGLGELGFGAVRKFVRKLFLFQPVDTLWMTPTVDAALFALAALAWLGVRALRGQPTPQREIVGLGAGLAALTLFLLIPPIHQAASFLMAAGIGVQAGRMRWADHPTIARAARRLVIGAAPVLAALAVGLPASRWIAERRAVSALPAPSAGPNILLIILDTVRAASLSLYGYERPTTPQLTRWAERGVRFTMAQSTAPWTLPSHASLFTGREAHDLPTDWYVPLDGRFPTLAEVLSARGYLTAGFVANLPYTNRETGLARGFQRYEDYPLSPGQILVSSMLVRAVTLNERLRDLIGTRELVVRKKAGDINHAFLRWLDRRPERPFFAFLNYYDAHTPFVPPEPFRSSFAPPGEPFHSDLALRTREDEPWDPSLIRGARNAYDGAIAALDASLGALFDELDRRGVLDSTVVIVTSDHGEEFAEHGLFAHGNSLYLPALHVPLLVWYPGAPRGLAVDTPVSIRDVAATIIDLAGAEPGSVAGRSLRRFWAGELPPAEVRDTLYTEVRHAPKLPAWYPSTKGDLLGVQEGTLRLIRNGDGSFESYDIAVDPWEQDNLIDEAAFADRIARLKELAQRAKPASPGPGR